MSEIVENNENFTHGNLYIYIFIIFCELDLLEIERSFRGKF